MVIGSKIHDPVDRFSSGSQEIEQTLRGASIRVRLFLHLKYINMPTFFVLVVTPMVL